MGLPSWKWSSTFQGRIFVTEGTQLQSQVEMGRCLWGILIKYLGAFLQIVDILPTILPTLFCPRSHWTTPMTKICFHSYRVKENNSMTTTMVDTLQKHPNMLHLSKFQATLPNLRSTNILAFWGAFFGYIHYAWRPGIIWQFVVQSFKLPVFVSHLLLSPVYIVLMLYLIWQHNSIIEASAYYDTSPLMRFLDTFPLL